MKRLLDRLNDAALWTGGIAVLLMSVSGGIDVLFTAFLGKPIPMVYELTEALMVLIVFLALGHLQMADGHIAMELVPARLGPAGRRIHALVVQAVALVCFGALTWQAWLMALQSWAVREFSVGLHPFPLYPAKFAVALGGALATMCCVAKCIQVVTDEAGAPQSRGTPSGIE
jgi:TRAP-type C4-dicarboxylate transport system permease small subunit